MSAAGQAITTFIRNHLSRCEIQQDQPLLLRHVMSGTIADDDLVPALYSRAGGAHCSHPDSEGRLTNFCPGTMVCYPSKAAGGPRPLPPFLYQTTTTTIMGRSELPFLLENGTVCARLQKWSTLHVHARRTSQASQLCSTAFNADRTSLVRPQLSS